MLARWYGASLATGQTIRDVAGMAGAHRSGERRGVLAAAANGSNGAAPSPAICCRSKIRPPDGRRARRSMRRKADKTQPMETLMNKHLVSSAADGAVNVRELVTRAA